MRVIPKVGLDGHYIEDVLADDSFSGVVPIYVQPDTSDEDPVPESPGEIAGYMVGIPVTPGLYRPRFDLDAWEAWQERLSSYQTEWQDAFWTWTETPEDERGEAPLYFPPQQPDNLWAEGLTPEEIAELHKPSEPSELERLQQENSLLKAQIVAQSERSDFIEDLVAEIAMQVYQ